MNNEGSEVMKNKIFAIVVLVMAVLIFTGSGCKYLKNKLKDKKYSGKVFDVRVEYWRGRSTIPKIWKNVNNVCYNSEKNEYTFYVDDKLIVLDSFDPVVLTEVGSVPPIREEDELWLGKKFNLSIINGKNVVKTWENIEIKSTHSERIQLLSGHQLVNVIPSMNDTIIIEEIVKAKSSNDLSVDANTENYFFDSSELISKEIKTNKYIHTQPEDFNIPPADKFIPHGDITDEQQFGIYTVKTYRSDRDGAGSLEILKSGQTIYGQNGGKFQIGNRGVTCKDSKFCLIGSDLTGNGKANLAIYEWSGGAHCCYTMFLFEFDEEVKQITKIDGKDSVPEFTDIDGNSVPELSFYDMTYAYWPGCFADSPCPRVILRWSNDSYVIAPDLMRCPAPSAQQLEKEAAKIRVSERWTSGPNSEYDQWNIPRELFSTALDLMYTGHEDLGWKFIEMAWTDKFPVDKELFEELRKKMASSPYWTEMQERRKNNLQESDSNEP